MIDVLILSPHLDDAALSCGGLIWQLANAGNHVHILTIFAGDEPTTQLSPFAKQLHHDWKIISGQVFSSRRTEDKQSCAGMGASYEHWDFLDCIYRKDANGNHLYPTWQHIIGDLRLEDEPLILKLADKFQQLSPAKQIYAPLTVGNHADHRIIRRAAEIAYDNLLYYEDFPYALVDGALQTALVDPQAWGVTVHPLPADALKAKIAAIMSYKSQLNALFKRRSRVSKVVQEFVGKLGGERIWQKL